MSTEMIEQPLTDHTIELEIDRAAIHAEVEAVDVGDVGDTEEERMVQRYLKLRFLAEAEKTRLKDQMTAMIAQLDAKVKALDWVYTPMAERLAKARVTEKKRSVKLHYGTIGFRKGQPKVTVTDETLLILTAKVTAGMEKCWRQLPPPPPEIVKGELNAYVKATGDVPAGCTVEPARDEFFAK
jgi:hypothetical protein